MTSKEIGFTTLFLLLCMRILLDTPDSFAPLSLFISGGIYFIVVSIIVAAAVAAAFLPPSKNYYVRLAINVFSFWLIALGVTGFVFSFFAISTNNFFKPLDFLLIAESGIISLLSLATATTPAKNQEEAQNAIKLRLLSPSIPVAYYYNIQRSSKAGQPA